jgi:hypothetical protein
VIESLPFAQRYTSGVLSFAPDETAMLGDQTKQEPATADCTPPTTALMARVGEQAAGSAGLHRGYHLRAGDLNGPAGVLRVEC